MFKKILAGIIVFFAAMVVCSVCAGAETYGDYEYWVNEDGKTCTIEKYHGDNSNVKIPSKIEGKKVTAIGYGAFEECTNLKSVTIPSSVISIGGNAFDNTEIVNGFKGDLVYIGKWLIKCKNEKLASAKIKKGTVGIADGAFVNCTSLKSVSIPSSVKTIGIGAFGYCSSLKSVTIPKRVTSISGVTFESCTNLKSVTIPKGVKSIGVAAFRGCTSLKSVTIPRSVKTIDDLAFYGCTSLKSVTIPKSVKTIGGSAFDDTKIVEDSKSDFVYVDKWLIYCKSWNLTSAKIKSGTVGIADGVFSECGENLQSVSIPKSVKTIGNQAFFNCESLKSVTIPSSVTSIGNQAFYACSSLKSVTIPSSVKIIGCEAFNGCSGLKDVYYKASESSWNKISIGEYNDNLNSAKIHYNSK